MLQIGWTCGRCTYVNLPTRPGCEMCCDVRPADYQVPTDYKMTQEEKERLERETQLEEMVQQVSQYIKTLVYIYNNMY